jgi:antibiotic biosynthesis monooxygenase (ABM) superfamily enzyme
VILEDAKMIERHVTFEVLPDKTQEFERLFADEYRPAMSLMPGFIKVDLLREQDKITHYQMVIRFQTAEEAATWRNSGAHQALSPKLKALYSASHVQVYDVVL